MLARGGLGAQEAMSPGSYLPPRRSRRGRINIPASPPQGVSFEPPRSSLWDWTCNLLIRAPVPPAFPPLPHSPSPLRAPGTPSQISCMHLNLCLRVSFGETWPNPVSVPLPR